MLGKIDKNRECRILYTTHGKKCYRSLSITNIDTYVHRY